VRHVFASPASARPLGPHYGPHGLGRRRDEPPPPCYRGARSKAISADATRPAIAATATAFDGGWTALALNNPAGHRPRCRRRRRRTRRQRRARHERTRPPQALRWARALSRAQPPSAHAAQPPSAHAARSLSSTAPTADAHQPLRLYRQLDGMHLCQRNFCSGW
jgi:hypothetical protein